MAAEGIHLLYHNHNCELRHVNAEKRAYDILLEETDPAFVNFEFDSYWFTEGGANALAWMQRLGPRMKLWHINDRGTRITGSAITPILKTDSMELGTGNMDLDSLMAQALAMDVDAVILESTATGWTTLLSRASSSVQNTLHKNSDLPFSHYFLLHYPHKSNAPHRLLLPVRGVVSCGGSFCVTECGCPAARSGFCHPEGDFCGQIAGHGDGVGHGIAAYCQPLSMRPTGESYTAFAHPRAGFGVGAMVRVSPARRIPHTPPNSQPQMAP